jgi:hypothetical protein
MTTTTYAAVDHVLVTIDTDFELPPGATLDDLADTIIDALQAVADCSVDVRYRFGALHDTVTALDADGAPLGYPVDDSLEALVRETSGRWWVAACQAAE